MSDQETEICEWAQMALARGQVLANEIETAIRDIVISNAAGIERFYERREELTKVDHQYLFLYAVSLVLLVVSDAVSWTEEQINRVIDKAAEEIVRMIRFRSAGQGSPDAERVAIAAELRGRFENIRSNFDHLRQIDENKRIDAAFTLTLMYLTKVHPASVTLLSEGNTTVVPALTQRFGSMSISARYGLST